MQIRKRIVTALAALIIIEAGIQLGATYARFGPQIHEGEVLALSSAILRGPDGLRRPVDPAIQTQSCRCRRMWDTCPCESTFRLPVSDHIVWDQLQKLNPEFNRDTNAEFPAQLVRLPDLRSLRLDVHMVPHASERPGRENFCRVVWRNCYLNMTFPRIQSAPSTPIMQSQLVTS